MRRRVVQIRYHSTRSMNHEAGGVDTMSCVLCASRYRLKHVQISLGRSDVFIDEMKSVQKGPVPKWLCPEKADSHSIWPKVQFGALIFMIGKNILKLK